MNLSECEQHSVPVARNASRVVGRAIERVGKFQPAPGSVILVAGCGDGAVAIALAREFGIEVIGVDADPDRVHEARRRAVGFRCVSFFVEDVAALPFRRGAFDVVLAQGIPDHPPEWERALGEMERVLKPGGRLVFSDDLRIEAA